MSLPIPHEIWRAVRTGLTALLLIAVLHQRTVADPVGGWVAPGSPHDPNATVRDNPAPTPWLDQGPTPVLEARAEPAQPSRKLAAGLTLAGIYGAFTTWTYFAWYRQHKPLSEFRWGGDGNWKVWNDREGWFGSRRYSAGADKLGHAWATYGLARGGTELLVQWGGFDRLPSTLIASGLSELLFFGVEIKDGFYYEFSYGDFTFNTLGAGLAVAMSLWPRLDELIDFRVQYSPTQAYWDQLEGGNVNVAEDYTGQTYMLALHLGAFERLRTLRYGTIFRFIDVAVGYGSNGYKPEPPLGYPRYRESKHSYIGISFNAQGFCDWLFEKRSKPAKKFFHGLWEVFNLPYGFVPFVDHETLPDGMVDPGGA